MAMNRHFSYVCKFVNGAYLSLSLSVSLSLSRQTERETERCKRMESLVMSVVRVYVNFFKFYNVIGHLFIAAKLVTRFISSIPSILCYHCML